MLAACAAVTAALIGAGILEISAVVSGQPAPGRVTLPMIVGWLVVQAAVAAFWRRKVGEALRGIDAAAYDLNLLTALLQRVEREPFTSPLLSRLHAALTTDGVPASKRIARLLSFVSVLDNLSLNLLMSPIGRLLLVRSQMAAAIDRWHAAHGRALGGWLQAVGELEALACFATYAYEHPADPFPTVIDNPADPIVEAEALAHPLIVERDAVPNDVRLGGTAPHVLIVSGSNMSGKSTLLRAVGVNAVLALAGAPVRARSDDDLARWRSAPPCASRTRCRRATRGSTPRSSASAPSSGWRARAGRCCFCSTRSCTAPTPTTAASAPKRS